MSTATELQRIINSKVAIKTAIEGKGVTVGAGTIDTYAAKIDEIVIGGGAVVVKDFLVRFFDYDGTILKQEWVYNGENATAPAVPTHEFLTFAEWNNDLTNIDSDLDIGAIYNTVNDLDYIFISLTRSLGSTTVSLSITKDTTSAATIDWGDGTTSTSTTVGNHLVAHPYSAYGSYIITVSNKLGGYHYLGAAYNAGASGVFPTTPNILDRLYIGSSSSGSLGYSLLRSTKSCFYVSLPPNKNALYIFAQDGVIKHINLPRNCSIQQNLIAGNYNCRYVTCNKNVNGFGNYQAYVWVGALSVPRFSGTIINAINSYSLRYAKYYSQQTTVNFNGFLNCYNLELVDLPSSIISIGSSAFSGVRALKHVVIRSVIPPSMGTTVFPAISSALKIYVPDASVETYKSATGWVEYSEYIYPLSTFIPYRPDLE